MDTQGLQELLSTRVRCTLTMAELLKVKKHMWKEVGKCLEKMGIKNPIEILEKEVKDWDKTKENVKLVPLNKVGEYCEGEDENTTLPIEYKGVKTMAILDNGAVWPLPPKQFGRSGENMFFEKRD